MTKDEALLEECIAGGAFNRSQPHSFIPLETEVIPDYKFLINEGASHRMKVKDTHRVTKLICQHCLITVEGEL